VVAVPAPAEELLVKGDALAKSGKPAQALKVFQEALVSCPDDTRVRVLYRILCYAKDAGDSTAGLEAASRLLHLKPELKSDAEFNQLKAALEDMRSPAHSAEPGLSAPEHVKYWENSLGMRFVRVPGTHVLFSIWETRNADYARFVDAELGSGGTVQVVGNIHANPTHPARVSWHAANRFCEWLTKKEREEGRLRPDQAYRLPTDLEWSAAVGLTGEYGATAKERSEKIKDLYPWGKGWPPPQGCGNYADQSYREAMEDFLKNKANKDQGGITFVVPKQMRKEMRERKTIEGFRDGCGDTAPVGFYPANGLGIYDLGGNLEEWCEDRWDGHGELRVLRGGSFEDAQSTHLLSSFRKGGSPTSWGTMGFRCVLTLGGIPQ